MDSPRYLTLEFEGAKAHDEKYAEVELHLLDKIKESPNANVARNWAEAYALIRGSATSLSRTEVKS